MPLIAGLIIQNLPTLLRTGQTVMEFVRNTRATMNQKNEWSDAHEAEFQTMLRSEARAAESQPDQP